ncbi:hypothetical protein [Microbacterium sp. SLBN-146]|uniref:hypothetical protein n=1 Tax=Microbacterium sp. SLBN-146 TaxID=2768457 RepID=UPI001151B89E|nr:hypothetical protein [Microbacterium sp. SLBN-146]TQJ31067.1 hypothetical protein FBY39_1527 [Microbacterium sp. SLBN-146]
MNDEQLDRMLRASAPVPPHSGDSLTLRQQTILASIVEQTPRRQTPRTRRLALTLLTPLAAALAILTVLSVSLLTIFGTSPAAAWGPAPLVYQGTTATVEETVTTATQLLRASGEPAVAERTSASTAWNLSVDEAGSPEQVLSILPIVTELTWAADLSGRMVTIAGEPFPADGGESAVPDDDTWAPGAVIDDRVYGPGEYPAAFPDAADLDADDIAQLYALVAPDPQYPGDALFAVAGLLTEWTLTADQHADLLEGLLVYEGLRPLGTTTDRLGREVVGIAAPGADEREATLLLSASTGRIVGVERTVLSPDDALGVPDGTVISYTLWKDPE